MVPARERALAVDTVSVKRDRVQSVRAYVRGRNMQVSADASLSEDLFEGFLVQRIEAELGNERDRIWCIGVGYVFRLETVEGHEGYTSGFFFHHDVKDFRRRLVGVDDDVEETEEQSESCSKARRCVLTLYLRRVLRQY